MIGQNDYRPSSGPLDTAVVTATTFFSFIFLMAMCKGVTTVTEIVTNEKVATTVSPCQ